MCFVFLPFVENILNSYQLPALHPRCHNVRIGIVQQLTSLSLRAGGSGSVGNFSKVFGTNWSLFHSPMWAHATTITFGQHHHRHGHYRQAIVLHDGLTLKHLIFGYTTAYIDLGPIVLYSLLLYMGLYMPYTLKGVLNFLRREPKQLDWSPQSIFVIAISDQWPKWSETVDYWG